MADQHQHQQQHQQQPMYSTLDAMMAQDAKKKALENKPKVAAGESSSIPSKVVLGVGATAHDDDGVSLLSMPTALQQQTYHTTHDRTTYPSAAYHQTSGQSSEPPSSHLMMMMNQQQATGESSQAIEIKLKGGTTDDGTITSPTTPSRVGGTPKEQQGLPALEVIPTTTTNVAETSSANNNKGHARHPSANYFDDGDAAPMFPNRSQTSLLASGGGGGAAMGSPNQPTTTTPANQPNQPTDMMMLEPYIPPTPAGTATTNTNTAPSNKPYIHTTYIRDPVDFAHEQNEAPILGPIDDLRIPLGLSSAPPSPLEENNQSPQNTGMGLNYLDANNNNGPRRNNNSNDPNSSWRRYIIIVIAVLAIGAIAFAIVILVQGGGGEGDDVSPKGPSGIDFIPPERTPSPTNITPTIAPSHSPTEIIVYEPPSEQDCQAVLSGRAVPGQVNMIERLYEIPFDIVINEGTELIGFLNQFMEGIRTIVIPELTRCDYLQQQQDGGERKLRGPQPPSRRELRDISNVVANAIATGEYSDDPCSRVEEDTFCQRIVINFVLYLKGDERNLDIAVLIRNAIAGTDGSSGDASLLSRFGLDGKADSVQATEVVNLNPTESPSASPTNPPSVKPSASPSNLPSMSPSGSPSASPTTSMPSRSPTDSPSMAPSSSPSCSETASWFDTEITSTTPLRSGGLVTYSLNCADRTDGIAVLMWDGIDKCTTQCIGYLNLEDSDNTCATSNQFVVSFNIPPNQDTTASTFLVGTIDPITAGSFSLACPGSILASESPSSTPSAGPTNLPSIEPSAMPSMVPSMEPSMVPSFVPSMRPSFVPSETPSKEPTNPPSEQPSMNPSKTPSSAPSALPTVRESGSPSAKPSSAPSARPSASSSAMPTIKASVSPSSKPSSAPSARPSGAPSKRPSVSPTLESSGGPTSLPSKNPTSGPTMAPSKNPTSGPTKVPSKNPTFGPSATPSSAPSRVPTLAPNPVPTAAPITKSPTLGPTSGPTLAPSSSPSISPSNSNNPSGGTP